MSTRDPYADAGGDWLLPKDQGKTLMSSPTLQTMSPKPSTGSTGGGSGSGALGILGSLGSGFLGGLSSIGSMTPSATSGSGDASAGLEAPFTYSAPFQVGGSGSQSQDAAQSAASGGANKEVLWLLGGVAVLAIVGAAVVALRK